MLKTISIIIISMLLTNCGFKPISVSILGILIFSFVRRIMKNKIEELVENEKKKKKL